MIGLDKIEEWVREVEERPTSAPNILRYIGRRLGDLTERSEELLAENILLRSGKKVEEYENRIANLEYQLDLLKRQFNGDLLVEASIPLQTNNILIYSPLGQILRVELALEGLDSGVLASYSNGDGRAAASARLLAANSQEELLFVFDSGRTSTRSIGDIPSAGENLDWDKSYIVEPHPGEELVAVLPVARMSLFDFCLQATRKGYVKKLPEVMFESHISKGFIGSGVRIPLDKTCSLAFARKEDRFVMVSRQGYLVCVEIERLPYTIEEAFRLTLGDYVVESFVIEDKPSLLVVAQNGKAIHREASWVEPAETLKNRGQALFSKQRRDAGVRVAGAVMAADQDWGAALHSDGVLTLHKVREIFTEGGIPLQEPEGEIIGFSSFQSSVS
jgi:DNA gyrase/topoisomerase IV subunit A